MWLCCLGLVVLLLLPSLSSSLALFFCRSHPSTPPACVHIRAKLSQAHLLLPPTPIPTHTQTHTHLPPTTPPHTLWQPQLALLSHLLGRGQARFPLGGDGAPLIYFEGHFSCFVVVVFLFSVGRVLYFHLDLLFKSCIFVLFWILHSLNLNGFSRIQP